MDLLINVIQFQSSWISTKWKGKEKSLHSLSSSNHSKKMTKSGPRTNSVSPPVSTLWDPDVEMSEWIIIIDEMIMYSLMRQSNSTSYVLHFLKESRVFRILIHILVRWRASYFTFGRVPGCTRPELGGHVEVVRSVRRHEVGTGKYEWRRATNRLDIG